MTGSRTFMRRVEKARANVRRMRLWPGGSKFDMVGSMLKPAFRMAMASPHIGLSGAGAVPYSHLTRPPIYSVLIPVVAVSS